MDGRLQGQVLSDLQNYAKKQGAILLKIDPDVVLGIGVPGEASARDMNKGSAYGRSSSSGAGCFLESRSSFETLS